MTGKLPRRLERNKLTYEEALALQLELEDEQLAEWCEKMQSLRDKEAEKIKVKPVEKVVSEPEPFKRIAKQKLEINDKATSKAKSKSLAKAELNK